MPSSADIFNPPDHRIPSKERHKYGIMPSNKDSDRICPKTENDSCPSGHMLVACGSDGGYFCKQCEDNTFQPNENWLGDKCRLRKYCKGHKMSYKDPGSTVRDAHCQCHPGYHFPNEDQRSCIPNKACRKGFAPGLYGNCESCIEKSMYSDTVGKAKKCKPLTNCEKQHRCTIERSKGIFDNVCGPVVTDLNTCQEIEPASDSDSSPLTVVLAGSVIGGLVFIAVLIVVLVVLYRLFRRRKTSNMQHRPLTVEEADQLRQRVVKECDRNPALCKKVFATSCSFIEERIDRQRWTLAQEMFRPHPTHGMYELLVQKYKDSQAKYTVNGYLQEFKIWQGETKEAVSELFRCLHQVKRDDIVNEICATLRSDVGYQVDDCGGSRNRHKKDSYHNESSCCPLSFCHSKNKKKRKSKSSSSSSTTAYTSSSSSHHHHYHNPHQNTSPSSPNATVFVENREAETKLLAIASDDIDEDDDNNVKGGGCGGSGGDGGLNMKPPGTFYHAHPSPSAPALEDLGGVSSGLPDLDDVKYSRQYSQPVQATS